MRCPTADTDCASCRRNRRTHPPRTDRRPNEFTVDYRGRARGPGSGQKFVGAGRKCSSRGNGGANTLEVPRSEKKSILSVPKYDFNWQLAYRVDGPLMLPKGSKIHCTAHFDNSSTNPANPDPNKEVVWGDQTWEEMVVAQFEAVADEQDLRLGRPKVGPEEAGEHEVEFSYRPSTPAAAVYLAGTFNEWKPADLKLDGPNPQGVYTKRLKLKPGDYEYKFVLDGKTWRSDPGDPDQTGPNRNSLLHVGRPAVAAAVK